MKLLAGALGKSSLKDLAPGDLVTGDPLYARITGVEYQYDPFRNTSSVRR